MAYYPNQNLGNGAQQPWGAYGSSPVAQPQQGYGPYGTPVPPQFPNTYAPNYNAPMAYQAAPYLQGPATGQPIPYRPYLLALFAFPFQCLKMFLLPSAATFAKEKDRVGWRVIWTLLLGLALLTGAATYIWGHLPGLTRGIQALSLDHVTPQPLSPIACLVMTLITPFVFLLVIGTMHLVAKKLGGKGTYRAQNYTALLISMPLLLIIIALALALGLYPASGSSLRLALASVGLAFALYSIILHTLAVIAVQQLSAGRAFVAVLSMIFIVLAIAALLAAMALLEDASFFDFGSGHSGGGSGGKGSSGHSGGHSGSGDKGGSTNDVFDFNNHGGGGAKAQVLLTCSNCGKHRPAPASLGQMAGFCPWCGTPAMF
ncbi:MAG: YIP1 family protein [Chloroflexota bacterium]|nr:YIP1 family protein [Chloroflexota bacterium]